MAVIQADMFWEMHLENSGLKPFVSAFEAASTASAVENPPMYPKSFLNCCFRALSRREFRPQILSNGMPSFSHFARMFMRSFSTAAACTQFVNPR